MYFCRSKNLTRDVGESRVSEGALSDQLLSHSFSICSMKMSCLVSLTCSFVPFDTSLTRPTHSIIILSPIVNKVNPYVCTQPPVLFCFCSLECVFVCILSFLFIKVKQSPLLVVCNCSSVLVFVA